MKIDDDFDIDITNASSSTDCTGLIQIPPENSDEYENYNDIVNYEATPFGKTMDINE